MQKKYLHIKIKCTYICSHYKTTIMKNKFHEQLIIFIVFQYKWLIIGMIFFILAIGFCIVASINNVYYPYVPAIISAIASLLFIKSHKINDNENN